MVWQFEVCVTDISPAYCLIMSRECECYKGVLMIVVFCWLRVIPLANCFVKSCDWWCSVPA